MELDFDDSVLRGLRRYIQLVSEALGLRGECWYVQADESACAYLALDGRLRRFPDRDVALLWDEERGWSAAIETHSGEDLMVVAHLGQDVVPSARKVAAWVRSVFHADLPEDNTGLREPARHGDIPGVHARLVAYATGRFAAVSLDPAPAG